MAQSAMYPLIAGGKETLLTADVTASDTTFYLEDLTNIPTAPNLITIKTSSALWERCRYTARVVTSGVAGYITVERSGAWHASSASGGAALSWGTGAKVLRAVSESDFTAIQGNITDHETRIADHIADISNPHLEPRDNFIINGDFSIAQRGTSFTSATWVTNSDDTYLLDRWLLLSDGNDIVDVSRVENQFTNSRYALKAEVETANKRFGFCQIIEADKCIPLRDKKISVSFAAKTGANPIGNIRVAVLEWTGTADAVTSDVVSSWASNLTWATNWTGLNAPANLALTTSEQTFKVENLTVGSSCNNLAVFIWINDTDASVDDLLYLGEVNLVQCPISTDFHACCELYECLKFLNLRTSLTAGATVFNPISVNSATQAIGAEIYTVPMRGTPTLVTSGSFTIYSGGVSTTITGFVLGGSSNRSLATVYANVASGLTVGHAGVIQATLSSVFGYEAEL